MLVEFVRVCATISHQSLIDEGSIVKYSLFSWLNRTWLTPPEVLSNPKVVSWSRRTLDQSSKSIDGPLLNQPERPSPDGRPKWNNNCWTSFLYPMMTMAEPDETRREIVASAIFCTNRDVTPIWETRKKREKSFCRPSSQRSQDTKALNRKPKSKTHPPEMPSYHLGRA